jgi:hypothetical protein
VPPVVAPESIATTKGKSIKIPLEDELELLDDELLDELDEELEELLEDDELLDELELDDDELLEELLDGGWLATPPQAHSATDNKIDREERTGAPNIIIVITIFLDFLRC